MGLVVTREEPLLRGIWHGAGWAAHAGDVAALSMIFAVFTVVSTWAFRWE